jgi:hypothetical protein
MTRQTSSTGIRTSTRASGRCSRSSSVTINSWRSRASRAAENHRPSAVRDAAERAGYAVEDWRRRHARPRLADAGVPSGTLQRHLARGQTADDGAPRLYVLDESSLASTTQINDFLHRLRSQDRVLFVGDVRQHQAVEAGTPYQQLQDAGIALARLEDIVRQHDPELKRIVEFLSRGEVHEAIERSTDKAACTR